MRQIGEALKERGLRVWLDEWKLVPGRPWQEGLETIIKTTKSSAVLVGKNGLGPWEEPEMQACLDQFVKRKLPVIPVLLPGAPKEPELSLFLQAFTWVDLQGGLTRDGLDRLDWGITGIKPWPEVGPAASGSPPPKSPPTTDGALDLWREKLGYLQQQEAITADAAQKFALKKQIEEAKQKIKELGG